MLQEHPGGRGISQQRIGGRPHMHNSSATGSGVSAQKQFADKIPVVQTKLGARGVSAQKQFARDQVPVIQTFPGARGVSAQSSGKRPRVPDKRGGRGVAAQRASSQIPMVPSSGGASLVSAHSKTRTDLIEWFDRLAIRLKGVIVPQPRLGVGRDADRADADTERTQAASRHLSRPSVHD